MSEQRTSISELGEFGMISLLTDSFESKVPSTIKAVGDDAAVIQRDENTVTLVSTDFLLEGVHFNLMYMPFKHLGYKAIVVNLSDIIAMNGTPEQVTVSI
ncbi:MAG: thiamine-phosphate kinase, partial [Fluviicola sp.]|nr:thiamine-phosphate kinase [Fluviicola sp.]